VKVDVVLLTKNSVKPCLKECLLSLKQIPINQFIVIDGGSTDGTLELCKLIYPDCKIIMDTNGNRATSRQIGIDAVETDWFIFIDSDVILREHWFKEISKYTSKPIIGAIQGSTLQRIEPVIADFDFAIRKVRGWFGGLTYKPFLEPEHRGFTGDILIRTNLVKDITIPKILHFYEDHYIKKWIENKGFVWYRAPDVWCDHHMERRKAKNAFYAFYVGYVIGYVNLKRSIMAVLMILPKVLIALCMKPNLKMAVWQLKFQFYSFLGVLKGKLTADVRRDIQRVLKFKFGTRKEIVKEHKVI